MSATAPAAMAGSTAQPVVDDGRVYAMDALDVVSAFDAASGRPAVALDPQPKNADDEAYGGGIAIAGGRAYIADGYGQVLASMPRPASASGAGRSACPCTARRRSPTGASSPSPWKTSSRCCRPPMGKCCGRITALPEPASLLGAASPAVEGDIVVVPYTSGELFALRVENGRVLWSDNLATAQPLGALNSIADVRGQPVIDRDRVFAVSQSGLMVSIDLRTGDRVWEQDVGSTHAPWVAGDFVYVLNNDNELICLTRLDGKARWVRELPRWANDEKKKDALTWTGPVLAGDRIIVVSSAGEALSISPYTGAPLGRMELSDAVYVAPVLAGKTLYFLTDEADLIALR